ncbi:hypothetical protein [Paraburkholderia sp. J10-1]|uniref:hypothetical protein n=1 Tax=Paraburkholderia sp. J10-1 TaxID=2805430 RepID=UPI002AB787E4|nr:hypothetical protein [Paraburkholderia sp. J10-1]
MNLSASKDETEVAAVGRLKRSGPWRAYACAEGMVIASDRETAKRLCDCSTIGYVGMTLGYKRFVERLIDDEILTDDGLPLREYVESGFFLVHLGDDDYDSGAAQRAPGLVTLVSPEGQVWLARRYPPRATARTERRMLE